MTRINYGQHPGILIDQHLIAETYKELPVIPRLIRKYSPGIVSHGFVLGSGHVRFFYDKMGYLYERYCRLCEECVRRGFAAPEHPGKVFRDIPKKYWGVSVPSIPDMRLVRARMWVRVEGMRECPRFYKEPIEPSDYLNEVLSDNVLVDKSLVEQVRNGKTSI